MAFQPGRKSFRPTPRRSRRSASTKSKREGLRAGIEELDLKSAVLDRILLADELVEAMVDNLPVAFGVGIHTVIRSRRLAVNQHAESNRLSVRSRPQHQVHIPRGKGEKVLARLGIELRNLLLIGPMAEKPQWLNFKFLGSE